MNGWDDFRHALRDHPGRPYGRWTTDKVTVHGYHLTYLRLRDRLGVNLNAQYAANGGPPVYLATVLEIGVGDGSGIDYFADVFGGPVYGIDNVPERAGHRFLCADQSHRLLWTKVCAFYGVHMSERLDMIVDDASHDNQLTAATLRNMWQGVRRGGFYVVEDWNHLDGEGMRAALEEVIRDLPDVDGVTYTEAGMCIIGRGEQ